MIIISCYIDVYEKKTSQNETQRKEPKSDIELYCIARKGIKKLTPKI